MPGTGSGKGPATGGLPPWAVVAGLVALGAVVLLLIFA